MSVDDRLDSLLLLWQEEQAHGRDLSAAALCRACPELEPALSEHIRMLRHMNALLAPPAETPAAQTPVAGDATAASQTSNEAKPIKATDPWATAPNGTPAYAHDSATPADKGSEEKNFFPSIPGHELLEKVGEGGMGVVYKARQIQLNRLVALKMILAGAHASAEDEARFLQEAELMARLKHPNVVQVYEFGRSPQDGTLFFSLELLEGGSLATRLQGEPQPAKQAAQMVETLAGGMQAAHAQGIIHRDLKPANVLLTQGGIPRITDFGLAKHLDSEDGRTRTGAVMGPPSYMAPEQAEGKTKAIGPAADIYALGAILYEMLTGRPPFKGASAWDTIKMVIETEPVPPRQLNVQAPRDLETICLKCLQKEPGKRYAACAELAADLQRWLDGEPIKARRSSALERAGKWARRKPYQAALAAALGVLFAVVVAALVFWQAQEARIYKQKYERLEGANRVQKDIEKLLAAALQAEVGKNWSEARNALEQALAAFKANPDLQAEELRAELSGRRQKAMKGQQALARKEAARPLYDEAWFHAISVTGLDLAANLARTQTAARTFLALYEMDRVTADATQTLLEQDQKYLAATDYQRLVQRCYELLLIWAEVEATPPAAQPGQHDSAEQTKKRGRKALHLVAQAARLGKAYQFDTQIYHLGKARYTALSKGEKTAAGLPKDAPASPTGALDWFFKGLESYRAERYESARQECAKALELQEEHFWARYVLALCHLKLGNWPQGKAELTVCLDRRRDFVWLLLLRGFGSSEMGNHASALARQYEKFKNLDDAKREAETAQREFAAAAADFNKALHEDHDPLVRYAGLNNRGVLFIRQQHWAKAIADLQEAARLRPKALASHVNLARAYQGAQRWDQAILALDQAVKLAPTAAALYDLRGELHEKRGDREAARADLKRAIVYWPKRSNERRLAEIHLLLGQLLARADLHEAALSSFAATLALQPKNENAYRLQAESLLALDRRQEAGASLDRYLKLAVQPSAAVCKSRGKIYEQSGQYPDAVNLYTLALQQAPADWNTRCLRGWVYLFMDAARPALADFEKALESEPNHADALAGRGNARIRLQLVKEAIADAEAALKQGPQTDRLLYNVTSIYALAVAQMEYEVRAGQDRQARYRLALYEQKALDCLQRTLEARPQGKQAAFWGEVVQNDPLLTPIRRSAKYKQMEQKYGGKK